MKLPDRITTYKYPIKNQVELEAEFKTTYNFSPQDTERVVAIDFMEVQPREQVDSYGC
jgi:hypothetical protein